jgi:glycosyltransferase involved in cell wall biosynthesis
LITTHFIGVSNAAKSDLERVMKTAPERTFVLYNTLSDPLDPNCLSPKLNGLPEERIVCVGRLDISKGQDILIHAVNILKDKFPNIRVHFIGTGKDAQRFQLLAEELGVSTNCHFIGVVPHHEVLSWMYSASLTVVPSRMDNLPTTAIESMAVGTPVIGTAVGGIPEVLGGGGILVPPEDPASLAESIASLLRDEQLRKLWSNKARTRFLEVFERSRVIPKHADFYEELLAAYGQV